MILHSALLIIFRTNATNFSMEGFNVKLLSIKVYISDNYLFHIILKIKKIYKPCDVILKHFAYVITVVVRISTAYLTLWFTFKFGKKFSYLHIGLPERKNIQYRFFSQGIYNIYNKIVVTSRVTDIITLKSFLRETIIYYCSLYGDCQSVNEGKIYVHLCT